MTATKGRKATPTGLKLIEGRGTGRDGKARDSGGREVKPAPAFRRLPPERPADLSGTAAVMWDEFVAELARLQLLAPTHGPALEMACEAYARWKDAKERLGFSGMTYTSDSGLVKTHPLVGIVERASAEFRAWCAEFGLTPAAETKLTSPAADGDKENPFAGTG
ncbi:phage terminase small subunit P27 family [Sphaerisporangium sp. TRM90804]|uniref:phage terminase small subunit P27 family n=1 Tax=Sphaerisporangium sp. TRM90804 TaxID=3031113 RepID=UPI0024489E06|nr:phage terminase small subunit P27 family [Sphaerisporangium sp. TRM90804]MDH2425772.1 phage terminase small subunit P27 family [Sphaerisporangium sp. TRM90804]